jgi:hypothetical protein
MTSCSLGDMEVFSLGTQSEFVVNSMFNIIQRFLEDLTKH